MNKKVIIESIGWGGVVINGVWFLVAVIGIIKALAPHT